jgi:hypothetical protein
VVQILKTDKWSELAKFEKTTKGCGKTTNGSVFTTISSLNYLQNLGRRK